MIITEDNYIMCLDKNGKHNGQLSRNHQIPEDHWATTRKELIWCYMNSIDKQPVCCCGEKIIAQDRGFAGYHKHCSNNCKANDKKVRDKCKSTCLEKYGVDNPKKSKKVKKVERETNLEKYGVEYTFQVQEFRDKGNETKLERYGDVNYNNPDKNKETKLERYGSETYNNRKQAEETCLEIYGETVPSKTKEIKLKIANSKSRNMRNYYNNKYHKNCFLYIIESKELNKIKIGMSSNMEHRMKGIKKDFSKDCEILRYQYLRGASDWENYLHLKYDDDNFIFENGSGRTEWFNSKIKDKVISDFDRIMKFV